MTIRKGALVYIKERQGFWQVRFGIVIDSGGGLGDEVLVEYFLGNCPRSYIKTKKLISLAQVSPEIKSLTQILKKYGHLIIPRLAEGFD